MLLLAVWLAGCGLTPDAPGDNREDVYRPLSPEIYKLIPGDTLTVNVYQESDLSGEFRIEPDGQLSYPLLGRIPAAGTTVSTVERRIRRALSEGYLVDPDVRVSIAKYKPVFVIGAVRRPGEYTYRPGLTAQQAVTLAGGPTKFASDKIYVQRNQQAPDQSYRISSDTPLYPGDLISVQERLF